MDLLPEFAQKINVEGATVDFFKYIKDGLTTYQFDTSKCGPPDPMVNAMAGLRLLDENSQLFMINHKSPGGLFAKIEDEFEYAILDLPNGMVKVIFRMKKGGVGSTDFSSSCCAG
ncbi:hypothetical protein KKG72_05445 [bacterium]|nr:hypothetical protein [bacterium]MBU1993544.1 hypothetical protein [bacterium]